MDLSSWFQSVCFVCIWSPVLRQDIVVDRVSSRGELYTSWLTRKQNESRSSHEYCAPKSLPLMSYFLSSVPLVKFLKPPKVVPSAGLRTKCL